MRCRFRSRQRLIVLVAVLTTLATGHSTGRAAELLRWKFQPGEKLHYQMQQDTTIRSAAAARTDKTAIAQTIDLTWTVTAVAADGVATMTQTIDRMRMKATTPEGVMEVDSASDAIDGPLAQSMVPIFKALIGAEFTLKMTPTGRIRDVEVPARALDVLKASPQLGSMLSPEALKDMTAQATIPLPDKAVDVGEKWTDEKNLAGVKLKMTYTFEGPAELDRRKVDRISTKADMEITLPEAEGVQAEMETGELTGEMFFDFAAGKLLSSSAKQNMAISIMAKEQSLRQEIQTLVSMRLVPPGEKEPPAPAPPAEKK